MEYITEILGFIIVITPLLIFTITMRKIAAGLNQQGVKIDELLAETDVVIEEHNAQAQGKAQNAKQGSQPPKTVKRSASRLILFLSGITSLILGVCITSYYFYMNIYSIKGNGELDLSDFTNVLLALGIGVVPYAVNQVKKVRL